jgi:hypothetical protein
MSPHHTCDMTNHPDSDSHFGLGVSLPGLQSINSILFIGAGLRARPCFWLTVCLGWIISGCGTKFPPPFDPVGDAGESDIATHDESATAQTPSDAKDTSPGGKDTRIGETDP